jgi:hypothetical protein
MNRERCNDNTNSPRIWFLGIKSAAAWFKVATEGLDRECPV